MTGANELAARAEQLIADGREQEALAAAAEALKLDPTLAAMWGCIGFLLLKRGRWAEAEQYLRQGTNVAPTDSVMRSRLAASLMEQNKLDAALAETARVLISDKNSGDALLISGEIMCRMGKHASAIPFFEAAIDAGNVGTAATYALGTALSLTGNLEKGLALMAAGKPAKDPMPLPDWQGQEDKNLHVILCGEYGFGDILHFLRYAPDVLKRVGKVTFHLPDQLVSLVQKSFPGYGIMKRGDALPADAGARCFYMDLPHYLGAYIGKKFDAAAERVPYLKVNDIKISFWEEKLKDIPRPRIALVWAGNPLHSNDRNRSVPFKTLAPLLKIAKPYLISLQRDGQKEAAEAGLFDATPFIEDFSDSAAFLKNIDLLITIDSAPAHLGGAVGIPVATLLPFDPDWRWLLGRDDCIWYPSMTLYRQEKAQDWSGAVLSLCAAVDAKLEAFKGV